MQSSDADWAELLDRVDALEAQLLAVPNGPEIAEVATMKREIVDLERRLVKARRDSRRLKQSRAGRAALGAQRTAAAIRQPKRVARNVVRRLPKGDAIEARLRSSAVLPTATSVGMGSSTAATRQGPKGPSAVGVSGRAPVFGRRPGSVKSWHATQDHDRLQAMRRSLAGSRVFVVGSEVSPADADRLRFEHTIGVGAPTGFTPDYSCSRRTADPAARAAFVPFDPDVDDPTDPLVVRFPVEVGGRLVLDSGLTLDVKQLLPDGAAAVSMAMPLAVHLGADTVYLVGVELFGEDRAAFVRAVSDLDAVGVRVVGGPGGTEPVLDEVFAR